MSTTTIIFVLVCVASVGYIIAGFSLWPLVVLALRRQDAPGAITRALALSNGWILAFLLVLLLSYLTGWNPGRVYLVLAVIVAVNPWALIVWWWRWRRSIGKR